MMIGKSNSQIRTESRPVLVAPTIAISTNTLTITDAANGAFATLYLIFVDGYQNKTTTAKTYDLTNLTGSIGSHTITVKASGTLMTTSAVSNALQYDIKMAQLYNKRQAMKGICFDAIDTVLFIGGQTSNNSYGTRGIDLYDANLTHSYHSDGPYGFFPQAANLPSALVMTGGMDWTSVDNTVYSYDTSLVLSTHGTCQGGLAMYAGEAQSYAIFAGGVFWDGSRDVAYNSCYAFSPAFVKSALSTLTAGYAYYGASASNGTSCIFAGGLASTTSATDTSTRVVTAVVSSYNEQLTKVDLADLSVARKCLASAVVNDITIFAGGYSTAYVATADAYDSSLTKITISDLNGASDYNDGALAGTTIGGVAIFNGTTDDYYTKSTTTYDGSLTRGSCETLYNDFPKRLAAASNSNYAIFAGSYVRKIVDAYDVNLAHIHSD